MRSFTLFGQRDYPGIQLGTTAGATIAAEGCYLTCFAMKASYYGHAITPPALNQLLIQKNSYQSGDLMPDNGLHQVYDDCQYVETFDYKNSPADIGKLQQLLADPTLTVTLELDFDHNPNDGIQTHFVEAKDCDGTNITIYDPWFKSVDPFTLHYGSDPKTTLLKFVVYKGTPQNTIGGNVMYTMKSGHQVDLSNIESNKVLADLFDEVMYQGIWVKKVDADAACSAQVSAMTTELKTANDTVNGYKQFIDQIKQLLGLQTSDDQPKIIGSLNALLAQEDALNKANDTILKMQGDAKVKSDQDQQQLDQLNTKILQMEKDHAQQIIDLQTQQQGDIAQLKIDQQKEIETVKSQCSSLGTQITTTTNTQETLTFFQRLLSWITSLNT